MNTLAAFVYVTAVFEAAIDDTPKLFIEPIATVPLAAVPVSVYVAAPTRSPSPEALKAAAD
jgi:hypothetical protein